MADREEVLDLKLMNGVHGPDLSLFVSDLSLQRQRHSLPLLIRATHFPLCADPVSAPE
jgi:hypothetical protein